MAKFHGGAGDGIGKPGDGNDGSAAGEFSQLVVNADCGKKSADENHADRHPQPHFFRMEPDFQKVADSFTDAADPASRQKGAQTVFHDRGVGGFFL